VAPTPGLRRRYTYALAFLGWHKLYRIRYTIGRKRKERHGTHHGTDSGTPQRHIEARACAHHQRPAQGEEDRSRLADRQPQRRGVPAHAAWPTGRQEVTDMERPEIILLDLNCTLIADQQVSRYIRPIEKRVEVEQYRMDLVEALAGYRVFMLTARTEKQKAATLAAISRRIPQLVLERAYFNTHDEQPPDAKLRMMRDLVLPDGISAETCFAVESNPKTRLMYSKLGILAAPYSARLVYQLREPRDETTTLF